MVLQERKKRKASSEHPEILPTPKSKPDGTVSAFPISGRRRFPRLPRLPLQQGEYETYVTKGGMKRRITTVKARSGEKAVEKARKALAGQGTK